jgi:nitronate monooxygenase
VALGTSFTRFFGISHPIALAPMGGWAGGALAAAVSNGGGLGLVGGGRGEREWVERELAIAAESTVKPWGIGFQSWSTPVDVVETALEFGPSAVMLSFGDPTALAAPVRDAGVTLIVQVTDVAEAEQAVALGADLIVAQGTEAGGHSGKRATLPFVPIVVDLAGSIPVLAAGGIADGRGLAASIALGASGALVGTRFLVTPEALVPAEAAKAIIERTGESTERNRVLDIARGAPWPERYPARTLRNEFLDEWRGREEELSQNESVMSDYRERQAKDDMSVVPIWASEAIDLIRDLVPATDLVGVLADEAEAALLLAASAVLEDE